MRTELLIVVLIVGAFNWAFRYFPTRLDLSAQDPDGALARFLASTGPAAIATLFVASGLPLLSADMAPVLVGTLTVIGMFFASRSVVLATLLGAFAYGLIFWLMTAT